MLGKIKFSVSLHLGSYFLQIGTKGNAIVSTECNLMLISTYLQAKPCPSVGHQSHTIRVDLTFTFVIAVNVLQDSSVIAE